MANWGIKLTHTAEISVHASARRHAIISAAEQTLAQAEAVHAAAMGTILRRKAKIAEATGAVASAKRVSQATKLVTRSGGTVKSSSKRHRGAPALADLHPAPATAAALVVHLGPPPTSTQLHPSVVSTTTRHRR